MWGGLSGSRRILSAAVLDTASLRNATDSTGWLVAIRPNNSPFTFITLNTKVMSHLYTNPSPESRPPTTEPLYLEVSLPTFCMLCSVPLNATCPKIWDGGGQKKNAAGSNTALQWQIHCTLYTVHEGPHYSSGSLHTMRYCSTHSFVWRFSRFRRLSFWKQQY